MVRPLLSFALVNVSFLSFSPRDLTDFRASSINAEGIEFTSPLIWIGFCPSSLSLESEASVSLLAISSLGFLLSGELVSSSEDLFSGSPESPLVLSSSSERRNRLGLYSTLVDRLTRLTFDCLLSSLLSDILAELFVVDSSVCGGSPYSALL